MTATIPTVIGQAYTLTYAYRGPGLVDWWPFEGDANDIIGTNDGIVTAATLTNVTGEVGQGFQFPPCGQPEWRHHQLRPRCRQFRHQRFHH